MSLPDLDNYHVQNPTASCYLDGRYFNLVFEHYPGLIRQPLYVQINVAKTPAKEKVTVGAVMERVDMNRDHLNLLRVVIDASITENGETRSMRHCNLILINHDRERIYWFEPNGFPYQFKIAKILTKYFGKYLKSYLLVPLDIDIQESKQNGSIGASATTPSCDVSGFCIAYSIKYAYDVLRGRSIDLSNIRQFASKIEQIYGPLDPANPDAVYGLFEGRAGGALLGGLGGAAVGTLVTGGRPEGALVGGLIGGLAGYTLSG